MRTSIYPQIDTAEGKKLTDLKDFENRGLIGVFAPDNTDDGHQRDLEVQRQAPVVDIPQIQLDPLFDIGNGIGLSAEAVDQPVMPGLT